MLEFGMPVLGMTRFETIRFEAPPAPDWAGFVTQWQLDVLLVPLLFVAVGYLVGVRRLAERGRPWPAVRTASFLSGLVVIVVATQSGLATYDRVLFSAHVVQHLLLGMAAPLLLVLGAPITLALQAGGRAPQTKLLRVLHSRVLSIVTHPVTVWMLFGGTLIALYGTGLYEESLRTQWVHIAVHVHFVVVGFLFLSYVVGIDPIARALGYGARLLFVVFALPFHAFVGVAFLGSSRVLASDWYHQVARDWGPSLLSDQRRGFGILWVFGEVFGVVATGLVLARWMRHEDRVGARYDRRHLLSQNLGSQGLGSEAAGTQG